MNIQRYFKKQTVVIDALTKRIEYQNCDVM